MTNIYSLNIQEWMFPDSVYMSLNTWKLRIIQCSPNTMSLQTLRIHINNKKKKIVTTTKLVAEPQGTRKENESHQPQDSVAWRDK